MRIFFLLFFQFIIFIVFNFNIFSLDIFVFLSDTIQTIFDLALLVLIQISCPLLLLHNPHLQQHIKISHNPNSRILEPNHQSSFNLFVPLTHLQIILHNLQPTKLSFFNTIAKNGKYTLCPISVLLLFLLVSINCSLTTHLLLTAITFSLLI